MIVDELVEFEGLAEAVLRQERRLRLSRLCRRRCVRGGPIHGSQALAVFVDDGLLET